MTLQPVVEDIMPVAPEMAALYSDSTRYALWMQIECQALQIQTDMGHVRPNDCQQIYDTLPIVDAYMVSCLASVERDGGDAMVSFLGILQDAVGWPIAALIHRDLIDQDVKDLADAAIRIQATALLSNAMRNLSAVIVSGSGQGWAERLSARIKYLEQTQALLIRTPIGGVAKGPWVEISQGVRQSLGLQPLAQFGLDVEPVWHLCLNDLWGDLLELVRQAHTWGAENPVPVSGWPQQIVADSALLVVGTHWLAGWLGGSLYAAAQATST